jgi:peptidyl-prolyl cis-trans isomerase B (cyclophilin B)
VGITISTTAKSWDLVDNVRYLRRGLSVKRGIYVGVIALLVAVLSGCSTTPQKSALTPATAPATAPATTPATAPATTPATAPATIPPTTPVVALPTGCKATTAVAHTAKLVKAPTGLLKEKITNFTLVTNCGDIKIAVDQAKAPKTITALTTLARDGYFDASLCHRLTTAGLYVLQCGDPTATGSGGPAFTISDENLPPATANNYPEGTVAMANAGANTNGSQFFLVFANTSLGPNYTIWGKITSGLDIVKKIAAAGVMGGGPDGPPVVKIAIEKVIVK